MELIFLSPENLKSPAWNAGQEKIRINRPKAFSKHVWTLLETIKGIFWILKFFWFFWKFSKARPSMEHWAKKLFQKNHPKTCSKHVWSFLRTILGLFGVLMFFGDSTLHGTLGKKFFQKNCPKTCSKQVWTILGTILGIFCVFELFFDFFENFRRLHRTLGKKFSKKSPQNTFGHLGTFLDLLELWNFFDFFLHIFLSIYLTN